MPELIKPEGLKIFFAVLDQQVDWQNMIREMSAMVPGEGSFSNANGIMNNMILINRCIDGFTTQSNMSLSTFAALLKQEASSVSDEARKKYIELLEGIVRTKIETIGLRIDFDQYNDGASPEAEGGLTPYDKFFIGATLFLAFMMFVTIGSSFGTGQEQSSDVIIYNAAAAFFGSALTASALLRYKGYDDSAERLALFGMWLGLFATYLTDDHWMRTLPEVQASLIVAGLVSSNYRNAINYAFAAFFLQRLPYMMMYPLPDNVEQLQYEISQFLAAFAVALGARQFFQYLVNSEAAARRAAEHATAETTTANMHIQNLLEEKTEIAQFLQILAGSISHDVGHNLRYLLDTVISVEDSLKRLASIDGLDPRHKLFIEKLLTKSIPTIHSSVGSIYQQNARIVAAARAAAPSNDEPIQYTPHNLREYAESKVVFYEAEASKKGKVLVYEAPELTLNLPMQELDAIVLNLTHNALTYANRDVTLEITVSDDHSTLTVAVTDDGRGFPPNFLESIAFGHKGADSAGSGIGLAAVVRLTERLNGKIQIDPVPGKNKIEVTIALGN